MTNPRTDYRVKLLIFILILLTFLPWLGLSPFNTKGEPREAIVAVSMLQSGNWVLPVSFGAEIPYKPPFLAWCIALFSLPTGEVSEFTSRLPSALAASAMAMMMFCFIRRRTGSMALGALTALITVSNIEVWRAAMACRVDMVLTFFIVASLVLLWRYRDGGYRVVPWLAVLCMTCAVLTKGPVGMVLPCLVAGIYGLLRGDRFLPLFLRLVAVGVAALVVPLVWYYAAYQQGGDEFLRLALEENFGRMTGTMSYDSHVKPLWYNFMTVSVGMLPYTLLALLALAAAHYAGVKPFIRGWRSWRRKLREADAVKLFAAVAVIVIFLFYCLPKSKRSVYLLPIYPFLSYFMAILISWMAVKAPRLLKGWCWIVALGAVLAGVAMIALLTGHAQAWASIPLAPVNMAWLGWMLAALALCAGVYLWCAIWMRRADWCAGVTVLTLLSALWLTAGGLLPSVLGAKSDRPVAEDIEHMLPAEAPIYSFVSEDMLRYYTVNFYMHDRLRVYDIDLPLEGYLLTGSADVEEWNRIYGDTYNLEEIRRWDHKSCDTKQNPVLLRFEVRPELLAD